MTDRERAVIRAIIRGLEGGETQTIDALCMSYGLDVRNFQPVRYRAAKLLTAMVQHNS